MKISLQWVSEFVDLGGLDGDEVAELVTLATAEVEGVERVVTGASTLTVARVEDVTPGGDGADARATLSLGDNTSVSAPVRADPPAPGSTVVYAPPGAQGAAGSDDGLVCTAADLGLGAQRDTVWLGPPETPCGTSLAEHVPDTDILLDIDNKSLTHRPDLWGHYGFARELAAVLGRELRPLATLVLPTAGLSPVPVTVDDPRACPRYGCLAVDVATPGPTRWLVAYRLLLLGQRLIDPLVDATNYLALELGQPTHVYDRTGLRDVRVARRETPTSLVTLDGHERRLEPGDLTVSFDDRVVGLAGIIGAREGSARAGGRSVLLESANFRAAEVRRTAARLKVRTEASQRFEKSQPPANVELGLARLLQLLDDVGAHPRAVSDVTVVGDEIEPLTISLPVDHVDRVAGAALGEGTQSRILGALGFGPVVADDVLSVTVPPFRSTQDISLPADVVEEVLRVHGYANIAPSLPRLDVAVVPPAREIRREHKARRILAQKHGFVEVENYLWFDDAWLAELGFDPGPTLRLRNPVAPARSRLRTTLIPNLLRVAAANLLEADEARGALRVMEVGRVLVPGAEGPSADPASHAELVHLAGVVALPDRQVSAEDHYRGVKAAVEDVGAIVGAEPVTTSAGRPDGGTPWQRAGRWATVRSGPRDVGAIGLLSGGLRDLVAPARHAVWFELHLDALGGRLYPQTRHVDRPAVPSSAQDFSVVWPRPGTFADLEELLDGFSHPLVQDRRFVSVYRGKGLPPDTGSFTFRYLLQHPTRTLEPVDLESFRHALVAYLEERDVALR